jgi:hypothetical protein
MFGREHLLNERWRDAHHEQPIQQEHLPAIIAHHRHVMIINAEERQREAERLAALNPPPSQLTVGQWIFPRNTAKGSKLEGPWQGPYEAVELKQRGSLILRDLYGRFFHRKAARWQVKLFEGMLPSTEVSGSM